MKNDDIKYRDIKTTALFSALWTAIELSIGTLLHASKIPFRGTILTIIAIILITISRSFVNYKGSIIAISSVTATLKLVTLPGFNITPFFAIFIEGLIGEIVFSLFSYSRLTSIINGSLTLLYTLIHSLIMQGVFFGFGIYKVYLGIINKIGKEMNYNGEISYLVVALIILSYLILGAFAGWFGWKTAKRAKEILQENLT
jgi:hypothetical protein